MSNEDISLVCWLLPRPRLSALAQAICLCLELTVDFGNPAVSFKAQLKSQLALDSFTHIPPRSGAPELCMEVWQWKEGKPLKSHLLPLQVT